MLSIGNWTSELCIYESGVKCLSLETEIWESNMEKAGGTGPRVHRYLRDRRQKKDPQMRPEKEAARKAGRNPGTYGILKQRGASDVKCC